MKTVAKITVCNFHISAENFRAWVGAREQTATDGSWLWVRSRTEAQSYWCSGEPNGDSGKTEMAAEFVNVHVTDPGGLNDLPLPKSRRALCAADMVHGDELQSNP